MRLFISVEAPPFRVPDLGPGGMGSGAPLHFTLKFLGEVPDDRLGEIGRALEGSLHGAHAFALTLQGMGAFPSPSRPRIVWVGVGAGKEELCDLARRSEHAMESVGFPPEERPFAAHVTVKRVRPGSDLSPVKALLERYRETVFASGWVRAVELKQSELLAQGARHTTLLNLPLPDPLA